MAALLAALDRHFAGEYGTVAVLTPYRAQKMALERKLRSVLGDGAAAAIAVQTVDGYQGQEADIVVFSCVRADREEAGGDGNLRGVGFLADVRRLNVAITRAKRGLWIVGHADTLKVVGAACGAALPLSFSRSIRLASLLSSPLSPPAPFHSHSPAD